MNGHNVWGHSKRIELNSTESKVEIGHIKLLMIIAKVKINLLNKL